MKTTCETIASMMEAWWMNFSWPFKIICCIQIILGDEYPPLAVVKKNEKTLEEVTPQINNFIYGRYFSKKMQRAAFCISRKVHRFWGRGATSRGRNQCMKHSSAPLGKLAEGWKWQVLSSFTVSGKFHGICRFFVRVDVPTLLSKACYILYIYIMYITAAVDILNFLHTIHEPGQNSFRNRAWNLDFFRQTYWQIKVV